MIEPGFTAFVDPNLPAYSAGDLCYFFGTISEKELESGTKQYSMNIEVIVLLLSA